MTRRGLIVGKFYPPHTGHSYLINQASSQVDELHIILCRRGGESPAGDLRASWLREMHPKARVLVIDDDNFDPDDSSFWAKQSVSWLGYTPDVVFTSEDYGDRFAAVLGCEHVLVDRARHVFPVSGRLVRENPFACWNYLAPLVRGYYARRICIVGAESTGKTTLAQQLARQFVTVCVPEYGRQVAEEKLRRDGKYNWSSEEFIEIAQTQSDNEDEAAKRANHLLVCDTDAFASTIWHQRYIGRRSPELEKIACSHRRPDIYFLTDVNTPFIQDGTRDGESIREWMHNTFISELSATNRDYVLLSGSYQERFDAAVKYIENHFHIPSLAR